MLRILIVLTSLSASYALNIASKDDPIDPTEFNVKALGWIQNEMDSGFPHMPRAIDALPVITPKDACKADLRITTWEAGMGSQINNMMNALVLAKYGNFSVSLSENSPLTRLLETGYFKQNLAICRTADIRGQRGTGTLYRKGGQFVASLTRKNRKFVRDFKHSLYKQYYQLTEDTQMKVTENLEKLGLPKGSKYIGVHMRRGDKGKENKRVDNIEFGNQVTRLATETPETRTVYIASDASNAPNWMTNHLGEKYLVKGLHAEGAKKHDYVKSETTMLSVLTDIEALRNAETFIGTATSNFGRLVYFLRPVEKKSISLDDHGDWLKRNGDGENKA